MPPDPEAPFAGSAVASYGASVQRQVPGFADLHRMVSLLLAEHAPADARVLVLGAGGGQEIRALAEAHPGWSFDGIDPSADMLRLAGELTGAHAGRVRLHEGMIGDAPEGPFDAATCILTFHFIARERRLDTLQQLRRRLRTGAPFTLVHLSFPQTEPERSRWIARHVAYGLPDDADPAQVEKAREAIGTRLTILAPEEEVALLREGGFAGVELFYAGLSIRGWVARAA